MTKSLVYSLLRTYFMQNSDFTDFQIMTHKLFQRLLDRGYQRRHLLPIFHECLQKITSNDNNNTKLPEKQTHLNKLKKLDNTNLYLHLEFHPKDISRQYIRNSYDLHFNTPDKNNNSFNLGIHNKDGRKMTINKMTVAYSKPKNLRDHLCPSTLPLPPSQPSIQSYINSTLYNNL